MSDLEPTERPTTSSRDYSVLHDDLERWLASRLPDAAPTISELNVPEKNGMSSETVLFDLALTEDGAPAQKGCVARIEPELTAVPVFPEYDLPKQFEVMRLVERETDVPVPPTLWLEASPDAIGAPFFVMERVEGEVPPDIMPYPWGEPFGSWLSEASPTDQRRLQDGSVEVLAGLHEVKEATHDLAFLQLDRPEPTAMGRHIGGQGEYFDWVTEEYPRSPLIERALRWLEDNLPADEGEPVLSWGDARIGNMLFRDFTPVGVLDWEMAGVGPREVDLGWMIYLHRFFEDLGIDMGVPTMPGFMRPEDAATTYERASGHTPRNLRYFITYAATRHAIVMSRVKQRSILFGEDEKPDDPDEMFMHRGPLSQLLDGTYPPVQGIE